MTIPQFRHNALFILWGSEDRELLWKLAARLRGHYEDTKIVINQAGGSMPGVQMAFFCKRDYAA